jgi:TP901 family phage tail tape measure protein
MQKDSRGAMLKVLDSLAKVPKAKQAAVMNALFGKESLSAIAPC